MWVTGEYYDALRDAETAARGRLDEAQSDPFARLDGFKRGWRCDPSGRRPLIVRTRVAGAEAWLFFRREANRRLAPLSGPHTPRFGPAFIGAPEASVRHVLLRAAARRLAGFGIGRIDFSPMLAEQGAEVRRSFGAAGWVAKAQPNDAAFRLHIGGQSFDDYWDNLPDALHERIAIGARGLSVEISDLLSPRLWEELELLAGPDHFLRDLAEDGTLDRTLRLAIARVGDAPVAAQLWTTEGARAWRHWSAEDRAARHLHPTTQLTGSMLRYLINVDHVADVDLGRGEDGDFAEWADERQPLYRLTLFNPRQPAQWLPAIATRMAGLVRRDGLD